MDLKRAALFYHFRDKQSLYDAVVADAFGSLAARLEAAFSASNLIPVRIERAVEAWIDTVVARPTLARLILRHAAEADEHASQAIFPGTDHFVRLAWSLFEQGRKNGDFKPALDDPFTYYNGVQPLAHAFDGFFAHSRGAMTLPLVAPGAAADLVGALANPLHPVFRGDLEAPIMDVQTEGDLTGVLGSSAARQDDSAHFRLWEVAGTAHADVHLVGALANSVDCGVPINNGALHLVAKSALRALDTWLRVGTPPVSAPRLELDAAGSAIARDADAIALGGIRTPPVDVSVDVLSGAPGPSAAILCLLLGSTTPLPDARLAQLYPNRAAYQQSYAAATDQTIEAGYVLAADRDALLGFSQPGRIQP